ncbi:unnamed protein product [Moneuplotes crassus]|uniref:Uncharacterized protein n=1 Tax=Euplotes crassus TaxID=5936 RepID=A0AAD2DBQ1_EUPCR|nr:unnamed protein product [Moneuplotes crassus]
MKFLSEFHQLFIFLQICKYTDGLSHSAIYTQLPIWTGDGEDAVKWNFQANNSDYPSATSFDSCQLYLEPKEYCWRKEIISGVDTYSCADGFYNHGRYCYELCGDGIMHTDPQVYGCDDGNTINGDGCSELCRVEQDFTCNASHLGISTCTEEVVIPCGNGIKEESEDEECDDGNSSSGDGCDSECAIEPGNSCFGLDGEISRCFPFCGNGIHDTDETCDDMNSMDYDGCDNSCQIESNFVCTYNPTFSRDICVSKYFPAIVSKNTHQVASSELIYTFNDSMIQYNFTGEEVSLIVSSPISDHEVAWTTSFASKTQLKIKYTMTPVILGGNGETLTVTFQDVSAFSTENKIALSNTMEFKYEFDVMPASATTESAGSGATFMFLLTFGFSLGISVVTGSSMELMWSLANTLQILFILGLLRLHYPSNLKAVYSYMKYSNFDNPITQWLSEVSVGSINIISSPINEDFSSLGFGSSNIIVNSLDKIFMIFMMGIMILVVYLLFKCVKTKKNWIAKKIIKIDRSLRYESSSRFIIELSMNLTISISINIFYGRVDSIFEILSFVLAVILFILLIIVFIYATIWPIKNFDKIKTHPDHLERHCFLFLEFNTHHKKCVLFYSYFTLRRIMIALVVIGLQNFARVQLVCLILLFYWIAKYQIIYKPYKLQVNNFLNAVNEVFLVMYCVILFNFMSPGDSGNLTLYGFVCIGMIGIFFILNWCTIFPLKIINIVKRCKKKCRKKTEEETERERQMKIFKSIIESRRIASQNIISTLRPPSLPTPPSQLPRPSQPPQNHEEIRVYKLNPRNKPETLPFNPT